MITAPPTHTSRRGGVGGSWWALAAALFAALQIQQESVICDASEAQILAIRQGLCQGARNPSKRIDDPWPLSVASIVYDSIQCSSYCIQAGL